MDTVRRREQLRPQCNDLWEIDLVPQHVGCRREPEVARVQPASEVQHNRLRMTVQELPCPVVQLFGTQCNDLFVECPSIESPQEGGSLAGELELGHHTSVA